MSGAGGGGGGSKRKESLLLIRIVNRVVNLMHYMYNYNDVSV